MAECRGVILPFALCISHFAISAIHRQDTPMKTSVCALVVVLCLSTACSGSGDPRLAHSSRTDRAGWVHVHLEGTPAQIGFQHGYLLAPEIDDSLKMFAFFVKRSYGKDWAFFRQAAKR